MYYVYIIESKVSGAQYVGMSASPKRRLIDHNRGKVRSTKSGIPWKIIYAEVFESRTQARAREKYLKSAAGRRYRKFLRV